MTAAAIVPASPLDAIDAALAERLLSAALASGGDYADLYFEYRSGADYVLEDGRVRTVGRGVTLGLGVRVLRGDATGYAYTEELAEERMARGGAHGGQIAASGGAPGPIAVAPGARCADFYPVPSRRWRARAPTRSRCCARADKAARAARPAHRARRGVAGRGVAEVLVVTLRRPPGARQPADDPVRRQRRRRGGRQAAGRALGRRRGASAWSTSRARARARRSTAARRRAWRSAMLARRARRPPARWRWCWAPGDSGILLHEAVGHGLEADFNRKRTSNYTDQIGKQVASPLCTVVDDGTIDNARGSINVDDEGNAGQRNVLIENGMLVGYMQDRLSREALRRRAVGQRPPPELPPRAAAAHDQHLAGAPARTIPRTSSSRSSAASTPSASRAARSTSRTATSSSR